MNPRSRAASRWTATVCFFRLFFLGDTGGALLLIAPTTRIRITPKNNNNCPFARSHVRRKRRADVEFERGRTRYPASSAVACRYGNAEDAETLDASPTTANSSSQSLSRILLSMASQIGRLRRPVGSSRNSPSGKAVHLCRDLVTLLENETIAAEANGFERPESISELRESIERVTIQAIRSAADDGDYVFISIIVDASVRFATAVAAGHGGVPLLRPRIFGEAIGALTRTNAGPSKMRQMWKAFRRVEGGDVIVLVTPPGAYELNTMISALASRDRIGAALGLYRTSGIAGDSYTASVLMGMLADSIPDAAAFSDAPSVVRNETLPSFRSPCWQWREALQIIDDFSTTVGEETEREPLLNNFVYAAALKVNKKAAALYNHKGNRHYGANEAMRILERMKRGGISPDIVTCTALMSAFDRGYKWKAAVALFEAMHKSSSSSSGWTLPTPNVFTYATAISACARCNEVDEALSILNQMSESDKNNRVARNRWVYNSALAALSAPNGKYNASKRFSIALDLVDRMEGEAKEGGDTEPNTVTYNLVLASMVAEPGVKETNTFPVGVEELEVEKSLNDDSPSTAQTDITDILTRMKQKNVPRDSITYHNAIMACRSSQHSAISILHLATADPTLQSSLQYVSLMNSALSVCGNENAGDAGIAANTITDMIRTHGTRPDRTSLYLLMKATGVEGNGDTVMNILLASRGGDGQKDANEKFLQDHAIDISATWALPNFKLQERHYAIVISSCLKCNQIQLALKALSMMKKDGIPPSTTFFRAMILACCRMTIDCVARETKRGVILDHRDTLPHPSEHRARAALTLMNSLKEDPPPNILFNVAKACAVARLWGDAFAILDSMHSFTIEELMVSSPALSGEGDAAPRHAESKYLAKLPKLHTSLLKVCAQTGHVTAALMIADRIGKLDAALSPSQNSTESARTSISFEVVNGTDTEGIVSPLSVGEDDQMASISSTFWNMSGSPLYLTARHGNIAMQSKDWSLLMAAASKSRQWKICLGTLQFLKPHIEQTRRANRTEDVSSWDREYQQLSRAFSSAVVCLEKCGQFAWALRAMDDWSAWSGRRPRKDAVMATCRSLIKHNRGEGVIDLVLRVVRMERDDGARERRAGEIAYERAVYLESITGLYESGSYDFADELYMRAVASGHLVWPIAEEDGEIGDAESSVEEPTATEKEAPLTLDLHGMTSATAHSAVRMALQREAQTKSRMNGDRENPRTRDVIIITGKGKNSAKRFRPVLRPQVQRMLTEEFYPPLSTTSMPNNMGALMVPSEDVDAWLNVQRQQKGVRLLVLADMLKSMSTGRRLRKSILVMGNNEGGE